MSRKSLILCLSAIGGVLICIGIAIFYLYSGVERVDEDKSVEGPAVFDAVPSDASMVAYGTVSGLGLFDNEAFDGLKRRRMSVSLHYSGSFHALYVVDVRRADADDVLAASKYLQSEGYECLIENEHLLFSKYAAAVNSASRHLAERVSIKDAHGFMAAFESVQGDNVLVISGAHAQRLLSQAFTPAVSQHSAFVSKVADWYALRVEDALQFGFDGNVIFDGEQEEFMTCMMACIPGESTVAECLPSYTMFALSLPIRNHASFRKAYETFADSRGKLNTMLIKQKSLKKENAISPSEFFDRLNVSELATASFLIGDKLEKINLMRVESRDPELIFKDPQIRSMRGYVPAVHEWKYASYLSSVYGNMFRLKDESCCTFVNGWLITGSRAAIEEYVSQGALHYTLKEYASHAGVKGLLSEQPALVVAYFSLTAQKEHLKKYVSGGFLDGLAKYTGQSQYCPAVMYISKNEEHITVSSAVHSLNMNRVKAPLYDRDNTVTVPEGPFKVVNSQTGLINTFYQNKQMSICLRDENGKDLWGVPFDKPICGTAGNVDVFQNGKLQIVFGAGSRLYVIDRLGRYVKGYPVDLGKEILIGPQVYDFSGSGQYSLMVLHGDNTLEMYTLKGKKVSSWKTVAPQGQTIKCLPELLEAGEGRYWIVRTSLQTLIYPSDGGKPLTCNTGDKMAMPDSEVILTEDNNVQLTCYDGKRRTIKLK